MGRPASRRLVGRDGSTSRPDRAGATISQRVLRAGARRIARADLRLQIEGLQHVPRSGPLLLAARHYHHLYDGVALIATLPRPVHILVGLDWVQRAPERALMERVCTMAEWPVVLRSDNLKRLDAGGAFVSSEQRAYQRRALQQAVDILRRGDVLVMFPEGYPVIDPHGVSEHRAGADMLPFDPGFLRLAALAERDGVTRVPIVPVGFDLQGDTKPFDVSMRFGEPHWLERSSDLTTHAAQIAADVRQLSGLPAVDADAGSDAPDSAVNAVQRPEYVHTAAPVGVGVGEER